MWVCFTKRLPDENGYYFWKDTSEPFHEEGGKNWYSTETGWDYDPIMSDFKEEFLYWLDEFTIGYE
jgi:hypothetical protein